MDEKKIINKLAHVGITGNVLLSAFKLAAGLLGRSGAMVSDAVHSLSDVFATVIATAGVHLAARKADVRHPYGHERFESVASIFLGLILAGTGIGIGYSGIQKLLTESPESMEIPTILPLIAAAATASFAGWNIGYIGVYLAAVILTLALYLNDGKKIRIISIAACALVTASLVYMNDSPFYQKEDSNGKLPDGRADAAGYS